jgi:radical SAM superfamily enzyme YgiQ (UPF0313 family)
MVSISLISPKTINDSASDIPILATPSSGLLLLGTILKDKGYNVKIYDESIKIPRYDRIDSDIILINSMSATINRAYEIADYFKEKKKRVYMGGIHVTFKPNEALKHCDKVVLGEGEKVIIDLIENKFKSKIIKGSPISVNKIIEYLSSFKNLKTLCFDEPNFTVNKTRTIELLDKMKEHSITPKYAWPSVSIDVANDDTLLKKCSDLSNFHFAIGIESINQKVLNSFNKKQTPKIIKNNIKKIKDFGIKVFGFFIFGTDYDKKEDFQKTVDFCKDAEIDFPTFSVLTPFVGTRIRKKLKKEGRILTNNWDYYDGTHVVIKPKTMTPLELQEGIVDAFHSFYSYKKIFNHFIRREWLYSLEVFYLRFLFKRIIKQNQEYRYFIEKQ